ncbi:MAG TPA: Calx-beta domain-containing protein, partial [Vicinamibacteria bacterium]|nr:Calx-beta domain-containing protein [Vicinamibacteria bacterium]
PRKAAALSITDNDAGGVLEFALARYEIDEAAGSARIAVNRSQGLASAVTVDWVVAGGTATPTEDYLPLEGTLSFAAGQKSAFIDLSPLADALAEGPESVVLRLVNPSGGATLGARFEATALIEDALPGLAFSTPTYSVAEGALRAVVTVVRRGGVSAAAIVRVSTLPVSASAVLDYGPLSQPLEFSPGVRSRQVVIPIRADRLVEGPETFLVELTNPEGAALVDPSVANVTILDDDGGGRVEFSAKSYSVSESAGVARVGLVRSAGLGGPVSVDCKATPGTAAPADFTPVTAQVVFEPGVTRRDCLVPITDDTIGEGRETVLLTLENANGVSLGGTSSAILAVEDDDPAFAMASAAYHLREGASTSVTVRRSGSLLTSASVSYRLQGATAVAGLDYEAAEGQLDFPVGVPARSFVVTALADAEAEGPETFTAELFSPSVGLVVGAPMTAAMTIDDAGAVLSFSSTSYRVVEGRGRLVVGIVRSGSTAQAAAVDLTIQTGTATAGADFGLIAPRLEFQPGVARRSVIIPIVADALDEGEETFTLALSNATQATLGPVSSAEVKIVDDDTAGIVEFASTSYAVREDSGVAILTLTRRGGTASEASVDLYTQTGSAETPADYTGPGYQTITFAAGESMRTVMLGIVNDTVAEATEWVGVSIGNPTGGVVLGKRTEATVFILDED